MEQAVTCRFCKGVVAEKRFSTTDLFQDNWDLYQCKSCEAIFLSPEPTEEQTSRAYSSSYYGEKESKFVFSIERVIEYFRKRRAKYIASLIPDGASVLDIGCGNGNFLKHLSGYGQFHLFGNELAGGSAERAALVKEINLKVGLLQKDDFETASLDVITMFHVFEHLEQPVKTLDMISGFLKKDGILVMSFPDISSWQAKLFKGKWLHLDPPRHLFFFKPSVLVEIMKSRGYKLVGRKGVSLEQNPFGWVQSMLNVMCRKRDVLFERLKGNLSYAPEYGGFCVLLMKLFFFGGFAFFYAFDFLESLFRKNGTVQLTFRKT